MELATLYWTSVEITFSKLPSDLIFYEQLPLPNMQNFEQCGWLRLIGFKDSFKVVPKLNL